MWIVLENLKNLGIKGFMFLGLIILYCIVFILMVKFHKKLSKIMIGNNDEIERKFSQAEIEFFTGVINNHSITYLNFITNGFDVIDEKEKECYQIIKATETKVTILNLILFTAQLLIGIYSFINSETNVLYIFLNLICVIFSLIFWFNIKFSLKQFKECKKNIEKLERFFYRRLKYLKIFNLIKNLSKEVVFDINELLNEYTKENAKQLGINIEELEKFEKELNEKLDKI
jgi:hypothetical protein